MNILAATDFSIRSQRAVRRAGLLARESDAELTLVYVVDDDRPSDLVALIKGSGRFSRSCIRTAACSIMSITMSPPEFVWTTRSCASSSSCRRMASSLQCAGVPLQGLSGSSAENVSACAPSGQRTLLLVSVNVGHQPAGAVARKPARSSTSTSRTSADVGAITPIRRMPARTARCAAEVNEAAFPASRPPRKTQMRSRLAGGCCSLRARKAHSSASLKAPDGRDHSASS